MYKTWGAVAALAGLACAAGASAGSIDVSTSAVLRVNGTFTRDTAPITNFDASVVNALMVGQQAVFTPLGSLIANEGLLGGPAPGSFFFGSSTVAPGGVSFSAVTGDPVLNSGMPGSTALFVDKVGTPGGTGNAYFLGDPLEAATGPNLVQFTANGATANPTKLLRPVSFDAGGQAIQVSGGEKGGLSAGAFHLSFDPMLMVHGIKLIFADTEINAALRTGLTNISVGGVAVPGGYKVLAGGTGNEFFIGIFSSGSLLDSLDVTLGWINANQTGGDAVLLDLDSIELIQIVPEPGTVLLLLVGAALIWARARRLA